MTNGSSRSPITWDGLKPAPNLNVMNVCKGSTLLKKSIMVSMAEKYVLEIEIFALSTGLRAQISRSCAQ